MKKYKLEQFKKGWIIGDFEPSILKTKDFEISIKFYNKNDTEPKHVHKFSKEITIVTSGKISMNNIELSKGEFVILDKNEPCSFMCLEDNSSTTVIKIPSIINDKYLVD